MNISKFMTFLESLSTPESKAFLDSVAAGFKICFESEIEITTKNDGKLPPIFLDREVIDDSNPHWKSDIVNYVVSLFSNPGKTLKESEYRIILNPSAFLIIDRKEIIYLNDFPSWKDLKERFIASHPEEVAAIEKRTKFRNAIATIDPDRWVDKKTGKSTAGKQLSKEGIDVSTLSMDEMRKRAEAALAKKEKDKFSELNEKLFKY